jgi:hypothetical protein
VTLQKDKARPLRREYNPYLHLAQHPQLQEITAKASSQGSSSSPLKNELIMSLENPKNDERVKAMQIIN